MESDNMKDNMQYVHRKPILTLNLAIIGHCIFITIRGILMVVKQGIAYNQTITNT
jgi:hypothetical protein